MGEGRFGGGGHGLPFPPSHHIFFPTSTSPRLRSGKARTLFYEKEDYHRIFSANGTGFSRAGRYGTNALYTWRTETTTTEGLQRGGKEGEEGHEGVQATMKLYMAVRACVLAHLEL